MVCGMFYMWWYTSYLCLLLSHVCSSFVMRNLFWKKQADSPFEIHQLSPPSTCDKPLQCLTVTWQHLSLSLGTYTHIHTMYTIQYIPHITYHKHTMRSEHHTLIHNVYSHTAPDTRCISQAHKIINNIYTNCTPIIISHIAINTLQPITTWHITHFVPYTYVYTNTRYCEDTSFNTHTYTWVSYGFHLHLLSTPLIPSVIKRWLDFPLGIREQQHPFSTVAWSVIICPHTACVGGGSSAGRLLSAQNHNSPFTTNHWIWWGLEWAAPSTN